MRPWAHETKTFWPHDQTDRTRVRLRLGNRNSLTGQRTTAVAVCLRIDEVGRAEKVGDVRVLRPFVDLARRAQLRNHAMVHHCEPIAHRERFFLIVRYVNKGDAHVALQAHQF